MKNKIAIFCLLMLVSLSAPGQPEQKQITALTNVTLIDGTGYNPEEEMTVLMEGKIITGIFKTGSQPVPSGAEIMNFDGHYLLPGLINSHVHLTNILMGRTTHSDFDDQHELMLAELKRMLYGGVTSIRDMAGDTRLLAMIKRSLFLNEITGPDLYYSTLMAGPDFTKNDFRVKAASKGFKPGTASWQQTVTPETNVQLAVARASGTHATGIKLYIGIEADLIKKITEEAHRQGLKIWAHSTVFPDRPIDVVYAGVDAISHACWITWQDKDLKPSENIPYTNTPREDPRPRFSPERVQANSPEMTELFNEMANRKILWDITLSGYSNDSGANLGCTTKLLTEIARASSRAGVSITTGTDHFIDITEPYPSVVKEIEFLVEQKVLSPLEVITAATINGARAIGIEDTHGTIQTGKFADMLLLKENPLQNITALQNVVLVIKDGKFYFKENYKLDREE